ncbi:MAG: tRNA (guanosine(37)-N1)-methyltransferase TrmD [Candidatus Omnitrophota bacterium]
MKIDVLTLFPEMFKSVTSESIIKRAQKSGRVKISTHNIRDFTDNRHRKVDDRPFGGGPGMVLSCQPIMGAVSRAKKRLPGAKVILMTPQGRVLDQDLAYTLSKEKALILLSGHYEGIDERVKRVVDNEISIGNYVLTGGELPAMVLIDALIRLLPGVLGDKCSLKDETFTAGLLEYPHYTRPADYKNEKVPQVLVSGNHRSISSWRKLQSVLKTLNNRPDLIKHIDQLDINY